MSKKEKKNGAACSRLGAVGGQAVLEGIMMKCGDRMALAVREESGNIKVETDTHVSIRKKYKILSIPIVRGVANFVESMVVSYKTLMRYMEGSGLRHRMEKDAMDCFERSYRAQGTEYMDIYIISLIAVYVSSGALLGMFLYAELTKKKLKRSNKI